MFLMFHYFATDSAQILSGHKGSPLLVVRAPTLLQHFHFSPSSLPFPSTTNHRVRFVRPQRPATPASLLLLSRSTSNLSYGPASFLFPLLNAQLSRPGSSPTSSPSPGHLFFPHCSDPFAPTEPRFVRP